MYIIELIIKKWLKYKKKKTPVFECKEPAEELPDNCEKHHYMPIDSSSNYLACKNCGHVIKNNQNPFL